MYFSGYTRHYPRSIPRPPIIHKWNPYKDPVYTASWVAHKPKGHIKGKHAPKGHHGISHGPIKGSKGIPHGFGAPKPSSISSGYSDDHGGHFDIGHDVGFSKGHAAVDVGYSGGSHNSFHAGDSGEFFASGIVDSVELGAGHLSGDSLFGSSSPAAGYQEPAPAPTYQEPAPAPTYQEPAPAPTYQEPAPAPTYQEPAPAPTYQEPAPTYQEPAPAPTYQEPEPTYQEPVQTYQEPVAPTYQGPTSHGSANILGPVSFVQIQDPGSHERHHQSSHVVHSSVQVGQGGQIYSAPQSDISLVQSLSRENSQEQFITGVSDQHNQHIPQEITPLIVHPQGNPLPLENESDLLNNIVIQDAGK